MLSHEFDQSFEPTRTQHPTLERSSLKAQSTDLLRDQIISGRIPQGTRMVEQELADLLGISRMPCACVGGFGA